MFWLLLGLGLFGVAAWLSRHANREVALAGLGQVKVVYSDTGAWEKVPVPLFSARYNLSGRPDYIVRGKEGLAVVEVKPLRNAVRPYESDLMQLAAYCLLLEEDWGETPHFGLLRYSDKTFRVEWTPELKTGLLNILEEMRELLVFPATRGEDMPLPQHDMTKRCTTCGFNYICWPKNH